jgi:hypothetical protein
VITSGRFCQSTFTKNSSSQLFLGWLARLD